MNIQNCTPSEARRVFRNRPYKNVALGGIAFAAIFSLSLLSLNLWMVGAAALVVSGCIFLYLESRVIFIECPSCRKSIDTQTPWECGFKQCDNENVSEYPFIHHCEHCHNPPKAYECHHCGKPIYLTPDRQTTHAAKCLTAPGSSKVKTVVVVKDVIGDKVATQKEEVRDLEHSLRKTVLEKQIAIEKNKPVTAGTSDQALEDEIAKGVKQGRTLYEIGERLKAKANIEFANDEHAKEQYHALVEDEMRKRMQ